MTLDTVVNRSLSVLGYPAVTRKLVNRYSDSTTLAVAPSARISKGCLLRGDVSLAPRTRVSRGCILNGTVTVGRGTNLEPHCEAIGDVEIGNFCAIARECTFQEPNHETERPSMQIRFYDEVLDSDLDPVSKGPITVGNDVWIGTRATILSGVSIGDGAIVGAGAIVTDDVDPYAVVAGVPAERVDWRFSESVREKLLELEWWHWDESTMREHRAFFERKLEKPADVPSVETGSQAESSATEIERTSGRSRSSLGDRLF